MNKPLWSLPSFVIVATAGALWCVGCSEASPGAAPTVGGAGVQAQAGNAALAGAGASLAGGQAGRGGDPAAGGAGPGGSLADGGRASVGGSAGSAGADNAGSAGTAGSGLVGPSVHQGPHHIYVLEYPQRIKEISADGKLLWEHETPALTVMFQVLSNGNVFFPHASKPPGAQEVNRNHQVVWSFESQTATEILGGERLANGNTLLGEQGPPRALELDAAKNIVSSTPIATSQQGAHNQIRHIHRLPNGNVLACLEGEGVVREFNPAGQTIWEYAGLQSVHDAIRLENGNTLIAGGETKRLLEVTPAGKVAWEFNDTDAPDLQLRWLTSVQLLGDGNILVGNWTGAGGAPGVHAFEVNRQKQVIWKFDDHQLVSSATTVLAVE